VADDLLATAIEAACHDPHRRAQNYRPSRPRRGRTRLSASGEPGPGPNFCYEKLKLLSVIGTQSLNA
jgi:hypothetical protein